MDPAVAPLSLLLVQVEYPVQVFGDIASNPKTMERSEPVELFDSETLFADERGISVSGDIILRSHALPCSVLHRIHQKKPSDAL